MFVSFNHLLKKDRGGEISTWPTECSLTSLCKFDVLIDPVTSKSGFRNRRLSKIEASGKGLDAILTAVVTFTGKPAAAKFRQHPGC